METGLFVCLAQLNQWLLLIGRYCRNEVRFSKRMQCTVTQSNLPTSWVLMRYDFIGDIHGHAQLLERILLKLGYQSVGNSYVASDEERKVVFLGDYINRGLQNRR